VNNSEASAFLLSVRPQFAERIYSGVKTLEIRKVAPLVSSGTVVLMYESGKQRKITGWFELGGITWHSPDDLWNDFGSQTGLEESEFVEYCRDHDKVAALKVVKSGKFNSPLGLSDLRQVIPNFMPPQNFRYLKSLPEAFVEALRNLFLPTHLKLANSF